jgi:hypothetical protein
MYETHTNQTYYRLFDSVEDVIASTANLPKKHLKEIEFGMGQNRWVEWVGRPFGTWSEVYSAARSPWAEGVKTVERMETELQGAKMPKPKCRRRRTRFVEDNGDELDYDRLRDGRAFWRTSRREQGSGAQTVTIIIDVNAAFKIKHKDILWRGAAALALTRILEEAGFRVEIWLTHRANNVYFVKRRWHGHCHAVCLKRPSDPLDVGTLVSACSGWLYRTLMFRAKGIGNHVPTDGLGSPVKPATLDLDEITRDPNRILISGAYSYGDAVAQAQAALQTFLT